MRLRLVSYSLTSTHYFVLSLLLFSDFRDLLSLVPRMRTVTDYVRVRLHDHLRRVLRPFLDPRRARASFAASFTRSHPPSRPAHSTRSHFGLLPILTHHAPYPCIQHRACITWNYLNLNSNSNRYNDDISLEDAIHTALLTLKEGFEGQMTEKTIEIGVVTVPAPEDRVPPTGGRIKPSFRKLTEEEVRDYLAL